MSQPPRSSAPHSPSPDRDAAAYPPGFDALAAFAHSLADTARALALPYFRTRLTVFDKADDSPVTVADREVEAALRARIAETWPGHGILGEEHGSAATDAEFVWVLDPIDGTRAFISGSPLWGVLVALLWRGRPVIGVIDVPATRERWFARIDRPTEFGGAMARASDCTDLARACLYSTSPDIFDDATAPAFARLSGQVRMRRFGGDCYSYGLLASGHIDLVVEAGLQPYDYLAISPVLQQAGAVITDWAGRPLGMDSGGKVLAAATPALHAAALAVLKG